MVDITMEMVNKAKQIEGQEKKKYQYFLLCSGQDYLIKSMRYIEEELSQNYPKPFIDCTPYDRKNWTYHKFTYNKTILAFRSWISNNFKKGLLRKALRVCQKMFCKVVKLARRTALEKCKKAGIELYGGSAWWILPDLIISYISEEYNKSNNEVVDILLNETYTPEETFFQIMAMRSPLKEFIELNPIDMVEQNCKTWAYFFDEGKPFKGHPYIITKEELKKIKNSDCFFARKFDSLEDDKILDLIDMQILARGDGEGL